jgi:hypothetical protein
LSDRTPIISVNGLMAVLATAVASSVLGFVLLAVLVPHTGRPVRSGDLPALAAIVLIWAPAFALIPAGILGLLVERPKARRMIARHAGGFAPHLALSVAAVTLFWFLLRIAVHLTYPTNPLIDVPSLALFWLVGLCSGVSWWFLVVLPGRRS